MSIDSGSPGEPIWAYVLRLGTIAVRRQSGQLSSMAIRFAEFV